MVSSFAASFSRRDTFTQIIRTHTHTTLRDDFQYASISQTISRSFSLYLTYLNKYLRLQKKKNITTLRERFIATLDYLNEATTKESIRASKETLREYKMLIRATLPYDNQRITIMKFIAAMKNLLKF